MLLFRFSGIQNFTQLMKLLIKKKHIKYEQKRKQCNSDSPNGETFDRRYKQGIRISVTIFKNSLRN